MPNEELKPCPFCGAKSIFLADGEKTNEAGDVYFEIYCTSCGCSSPKGKTKEEAKRLWNKRHSEVVTPDNCISEQHEKNPCPYPAFPSCVKSISRYFLEQLNAGEYDELLASIADEGGKK